MKRNSKQKKLYVQMTSEEFERHYWYLGELREFASDVGIPMAKKLRKDELELLIKKFLKTKKAPNEIPKRFLVKRHREKDSKEGLSLLQPVRKFTWDYVTRDFLESEIQKRNPRLKAKSGEKYWTNRWLEKNEEPRESNYL